MDPETPRQPHTVVPETPPASVSKKPFTVPVFALPNKTPKARQQTQLETPATHGRTRVLDLAPPPSSAFPLLPQFTPHRSPHHRRRRVFAADVIGSDPVPLLLPNHAVSGSGRRSQGPSKSLKAPFLLGFEELARLNENLAFEEDTEGDSGQEFDFAKLNYGADLLDSPSKKPKRKQRLTATTEPTKAEFVPKTPGKQLITEKQVHKWQESSSRLEELSDEDWNEPRKTLANPFLSDSTVSSSMSSASKRKLIRSDIDYDTHMELINHRTGERRVEPLSPSQRQLRPRRIDFSAV